MRLSVETAISLIVAVLLVVLDKAGMLKPAMLLLLIVFAGSLAIHPTFVAFRVGKAASRFDNLLRGVCALAIVFGAFGALGKAIWPRPQQQPEVTTSAPKLQETIATKVQVEPTPRITREKHPLHQIKTPSAATANPADVPQSHQVISAPYGIAIGGGTVTNPTVYNYPSPKPPELRVKQDGNKITLSAEGGSISPVSVAFFFSGPVSFEGGVPRACMMCGSARRRGPNGIEDPRTVWVFWRMPPLTPGDDVSFTYTPVEGYVSLVTYKEVPIPY